MGVEGIFAFNLGKFEFLSVQLSNNFRPPMLGELREFLIYVDLGCHLLFVVHAEKSIHWIDFLSYVPPHPLKAVTSISIFIFGSTMPAITIVAAGRMLSKWCLMTGKTSSIYLRSETVY